MIFQITIPCMMRKTQIKSTQEEKLVLSKKSDNADEFKILKNVNFYKKNTCHLFDNNLVKYDLVWLDGSHSYPEISWDVFYALSSLSKTGILLIDDIFIEKYYKKINFLDQIDAYKVIKYYNDRDKIKFKFFTKRTNSKEKKFIAYYHNLKN